MWSCSRFILKLTYGELFIEGERAGGSDLHRRFSAGVCAIQYSEGYSGRLIRFQFPTAFLSSLRLCSSSRQPSPSAKCAGGYWGTRPVSPIQCHSVISPTS